VFASTHLVGSPPFFMTICLHCLGETDPKVPLFLLKRSKDGPQLQEYSAIFQQSLNFLRFFWKFGILE